MKMLGKRITMAKTDYIDYLKKTFDIDGVQPITEMGYRVIQQTHLVTDQYQADVLISIIENVAGANYNGGYSDGASGQAYKDGIKAGQLQKQIDVLTEKLKAAKA